MCGLHAAAALRSHKSSDFIQPVTLSVLETSRPKSVSSTRKVQAGLLSPGPEEESMSRPWQVPVYGGPI